MSFRTHDDQQTGDRAADPFGRPASSDDRAQQVAARLARVRAAIFQAARSAGRSPSAVTLVAVSKTVDTEAIVAARATGHSDFGESRAQELRRKVERVGAGVRWHFVGRLQRNKVRDVVGTASLIHSVDRLDLAATIAERALRDGRVQRVLVQVNIGDDPAKGGCPADEALALVSKVRELHGIACEGLMTIPPRDAPPGPAFAALRDLRDGLRARFPEIQHLSMGMSHDFETAIEQGATIVRVGEAVFGPRPQPASPTPPTVPPGAPG